jgi:hypothetical protein
VRIARVIAADPEETAPFVRLALERDGALYDVAELDRIFDTPHAPDRLACADDFHARVIALGCAGLARLDDRLRAGDRPTEARLFPDAFAWLPPCDTDRACFVRVIASDRPSLRVGSARAILGHGARIPFPDDETRPDFEPAIAAILGEDLDAATPSEAEAAILGYTILNVWSGQDERAQDPASSGRVPSQLGATLVTADEVGDLGRLRADVRVGGASIGATPLAAWAHEVPSSIAWASRWAPLRAGDVVGVHPPRAADRAPLAWESRVEVLVERLGKLTGQPRRADVHR